MDEHDKEKIMRDLIIELQDGNKYRINENFEITEYDNFDFKTGTEFNGIQSIKNKMVSTYRSAFDEKYIHLIQSDLLNKKGTPAFVLNTIKNGIKSEMIWRGSKQEQDEHNKSFQGIISIYYEDRMVQE